MNAAAIRCRGLMVWDFWSAAAVLYGAGLAAGLVRTDGPPLTRLALAALWPIGPLAFVATLTLLRAASLVAFPVFGAIVFGAIVAATVAALVLYSALASV